jgi:hypothetical protein
VTPTSRHPDVPHVEIMVDHDTVKSFQVCNRCRQALCRCTQCSAIDEPVAGDMHVHDLKKTVEGYVWVCYENPDKVYGMCRRNVCMALLTNQGCRDNFQQAAPFSLEYVEEQLGDVLHQNTAKNLPQR